MGTYKLTTVRYQDDSATQQPVALVLVFEAVAGDQEKITEEYKVHDIFHSGHVLNLHLEWIGKFDGKFYPYIGIRNAVQGASYENINPSEKTISVYGSQLSGTMILVRPQSGYTLTDDPIGPYYMAFDRKSCTVVTKYYTAVYHKH